MRLLHYDIESMSEIFTLCAFDENNDTIFMFYLFPEYYTLTEQMSAEIVKQIIKENPECGQSTIYMLDLSKQETNLFLAQMFGMRHPACPGFSSNYSFPMDIDPGFNEEQHWYACGYNSLNYDMTILALYLAEIFYAKSEPDEKGITVKETFGRTTPAIIREYNDELFDPHFKPCMPARLRYSYAHDPAEQKRFSTYRINGKFLKDDGWRNDNPAFHIYQNMVKTGRHIDIARLNEKQARVALKRLLGMLGDKIMEPNIDLSQKNGQSLLSDFELVKNIFAYNVSDVIRLPHLFQHKVYRAKFILKRQMLKTYPELVFNNNGQYKPDMKTLRYNRLTINSTSAQLAAGSLCPYGALGDTNCVSFNYPAEKKAEELGITVTNVLQDTIDFIETRMRPLAMKSKDPRSMEIISSLYKVIDMYGSMEGKDFNSSHAEDGCTTYSVDAFASNVCLCYMGPDGRPSSCYVNFSIGGIHGAEYNKALFESDLAAFNKKQYLYKKVREIYGDAINLVIDVNAKGKTVKRKFVEITDGDYPGTYPVSDFLKSGSTLKKASYKKEFLEPSPPMLFPVKDGKPELNKKYVWTSFGLMNHEDFTSYYPRMLMMLMAFWNINLGYDRYEEIFNNKTDYGFLMKEKNAHMTEEQALIYEGLRKATQLDIDRLNISEEERNLYVILREGTKLVLNSASGTADSEKDNPIRMNNRILTMRILGQLFAWRIGQAQALEGAKVVSTNTDGLYTDMEENLNNQILYREAEAAHVEIEPERVFLVSKDANNRIECKPNTYKIIGAGGGTLGCYKGPSPDKALAHPAIMDWAMGHFLIYKAKKGAIDEYEPSTVMAMMKNEAAQEFSDTVKYLIMFQNITASSPNVGCYHFATKEPVTGANIDTIEPIFLHHYNRVFYVDPEKVPEDKKKNIVYIAAAYVRPHGKTEESRTNIPLAIKVIKDMNGDRNILAKGAAKIKKLNGIELDTPCMIVNEQLSRADFDPAWLDYEYYAKVLGKTYKKSWQNVESGIRDEDDNDENTED